MIIGATLESNLKILKLSEGLLGFYEFKADELLGETHPNFNHNLCLKNIGKI